MNKQRNCILKDSDNKCISWHWKPQNTQAIIWISYDEITIGMGWMNTYPYTDMHTANFLLPNPHSLHTDPHTHTHTLVDMQLDKWVFDEALGTHTLPFQSCFHNCRAQLYQPTLTKLYLTGPLIPLHHRESHPARLLQTGSHFPRCHTMSKLNGNNPMVLLNMICWHSAKLHSVMEQLKIALKIQSTHFVFFFFVMGMKSKINIRVLSRQASVWWLWLDSHFQMPSRKLVV